MSTRHLCIEDEEFGELSYATRRTLNGEPVEPDEDGDWDTQDDYDEDCDDDKDDEDDDCDEDEDEEFIEALLKGKKI